MRRLYLQIYLTIIAILVIVDGRDRRALARLAFDESRFDDMLDGRGRARRQCAAAAGCAARAAAGGDRRSCTRACASTSRSMRRDGALIAAAGRPLPPLEIDSPSSVRLRGGTAAPGCSR